MLPNWLYYELGGRPGFDVGNEMGLVHIEAPFPRKSMGKTINANDERFALAA
jgi:hypothetical protein